MRLPIATYTGDDVLRIAQRCRMDLTRVVSEEFFADGQFAFASQEWPTLPDANCVESTSALSLEQLDRVNEAFAVKGARCLRWTLPTESAELLRRGAAVRRLRVMRLNRWQQQPAAPSMVLQARAAPAKVEQLLRRRFAADAAVAARLAWVDDPQDEWLVAIDGGVGQAAAALIVSGDAGMLHDLLPDEAGAALRHLVDRLIEYAGRAGLKHVVACADKTEADLLQTAGFVQIGQIVRHDVPV